jgi:hypothetical protein
VNRAAQTGDHALRYSLAAVSLPDPNQSREVPEGDQDEEQSFGCLHVSI